MSENINVQTSQPNLAAPGDHVLKFWLVDAGVALQKLVREARAVNASFLGPPENRFCARAGHVPRVAAVRELTIPGGSPLFAEARGVPNSFGSLCSACPTSCRVARRERDARPAAALVQQVRFFDAVRLDHAVFGCQLVLECLVGRSRSAHRVDKKFFVPTANSWYIASCTTPF